METIDPPQVVYEDADLLAVNKPPGLLTHPSPLDPHAETSLVTILRESFGGCIFPCHRLDRATSGVILFAKSKPALSAVNAAFAGHTIGKRYLGLVRGWIFDRIEVDYPLTLESPRKRGGSLAQQAAITVVEPIARFESPIASGRYPSTRLSLCAIAPQTGRRHQIRRHLAHIRHPLVGDTTHGDGKLNQWAHAVFHAKRLFLHASELTLSHPVSAECLRICADPDQHWRNSLQALAMYDRSSGS